ncbi:MAG TPA: PDDEXK nuclease domain-containing protein [Kofleriaceae bacterium]
MRPFERDALLLAVLAETDWRFGRVLAFAQDCVDRGARTRRPARSCRDNFKRTLPPPDSDFAAQVFKDPYLFDFLGTADPRQDHEVEASLVAHVERFRLELGKRRLHDFAVGPRRRECAHVFQVSC